MSMLLEATAPSANGTNGHSNGAAPRSLTPAQWAAVEALLSGARQSEAAAKAGVTDRTLRNWSADPAFKAELASAREAMLEVALGGLPRRIERAFAILEVFATGHPDYHIRLKALDLTLRWSFRLLQAEKEGSLRRKAERLEAEVRELRARCGLMEAQETAPKAEETGNEGLECTSNGTLRT